LPGVPQSVIDRQDKIASLVLVKLDGPTYSAIMDHCTSSATRQKAWTLYRRRAGMENVTTLQQLIKLRAEMARILGYGNFVDYITEDRMAKNSQNVREFYDEIIPLVAQKAKDDYQLFQDAKREYTKNSTTALYPWDYSFTKNYLLKTKYAVDSQKVAEYFPVENVLKGLTEVTGRLFGIEYKDVSAQAGQLGLPLWHPDVKLYEVIDKATGNTLGRMYTDLHPRPMPPPMGRPIFIPRRSSMLPLPARPCHLISVLLMERVHPPRTANARWMPSLFGDRGSGP
jgi:thimet oligopeptidase